MNAHNQADRFWDEHYSRRAGESPVAKVNPRLAEIAGPLPLARHSTSVADREWEWIRQVGR